MIAQMQKDPFSLKRDTTLEANWATINAQLSTGVSNLSPERTLRYVAMITWAGGSDVAANQ